MMQDIRVLKERLLGLFTKYTVVIYWIIKNEEYTGERIRKRKRERIRKLDSDLTG